jgi:hypothetical protein
MKIQDENAVRAALRDEYAEAFPNGSEDFTTDEYVEKNLRDVMARVAALSQLERLASRRWFAW